MLNITEKQSKIEKLIHRSRERGTTDVHIGAGRHGLLARRCKNETNVRKS
jgi:hypothetical protein